MLICNLLIILFSSNQNINHYCIVKQRYGIHNCFGLNELLFILIFNNYYLNAYVCDI